MVSEAGYPSPSGQGEALSEQAGGLAVADLVGQPQAGFYQSRFAHQAQFLYFFSPSPSSPISVTVHLFSLAHGTGLFLLGTGEFTPCPLWSSWSRRPSTVCIYESQWLGLAVHARACLCVPVCVHSCACVCMSGCV